MCSRTSHAIEVQGRCWPLQDSADHPRRTKVRQITSQDCLRQVTVSTMKDDPRLVGRRVDAHQQSDRSRARKRRDGCSLGGAGESVAGGIIALKLFRKIKTVVTRGKQAASFAARDDAMFTSRPGVYWATTVADAFNLFSGPAVAMSRPCPLLAISGYPSRGERLPASSKC